MHVKIVMEKDNKHN